MHTAAPFTVPPGCTGHAYLVNPDAPDEGHDIAHDVACPTHPDATLACAWCGRLTVVVRRPFGTRAYAVGGKVRGELCPSCAADSRDIEADALTGLGDRS